jgi:SOS response regulatory protein OraA/RecX
VGDDERRDALLRATRALARRDHSAASLRAKLDRAGISEGAQIDALDALARGGYLDDGRFARDRAAHLAARGYGDGWIRGHLEAQGVPVESVDTALDELEPERDRMAREAVRLGGGLRAARSLARRGFSEENLEALVAQDPGAGVG